MINVAIFNTGSGGKDIYSRLQKSHSIKSFLLIDNSFSGNDTKKVVIEKTKKAINKLKKKKFINIVIACHTAISSIFDDILKNKKYLRNVNIYEPIVPVCNVIINKKYTSVTILCTKLTKRLKIHEKVLGFKCNYISSKNLADYIDEKYNVSECITNLLKDIDVLNTDCIVLGCTHYSLVEKQIKQQLSEKNYTGVILNANKILVNHINNLLM